MLDDGKDLYGEKKRYAVRVENRRYDVRGNMRGGESVENRSIGE